MNDNITKLELPFRVAEQYRTHKQDILILTHSEGEAKLLNRQLNFFIADDAVYHLSSLDSLPYDRISPSRKVQAQRAKTLVNLASKPLNKILTVNVINLLHKYILPNELIKGGATLVYNQKISIEEVVDFFITNGFTRTPCATEIGDFAQRGEIFDVIISGTEAYRINFSWGRISAIRCLDIETQVSTGSVNEVKIYPTSELNLNSEKIEYFKENFLKHFGINNTKSLLYSTVTQGIKFAGIETLAPLFNKQSCSLLAYLHNPIVYCSTFTEQALSQKIDEYQEYYNAKKGLLSNTITSGENFEPALPPSELIYSMEAVDALLSTSEKIQITSHETASYRFLPDFYQQNNNTHNQSTPIQKLQNLISENPSKVVIVMAATTSGVERLKVIFNNYDLPYKDIAKFTDSQAGIINIVVVQSDTGYITPSHIFVTEKALIGERKYIASSRKKLKNLLQELDNFTEGDLVVHSAHGIGEFAGITTIEISGIKHDCIKLLYAKGDKLFIPVENIELIKRYGNEGAELDVLGGGGWQKRKAKLKERINKIAQDFIKLAAQRKLASTDPINFDNKAYEEFCSRFPYLETEDQLKAIQDITNDLQLTKPMERLICGDVGFGKTEVAMRAAYQVSHNNLVSKQVAIIVPTTILCSQHYSNFIERFKGCDIHVAQLSRLVSNNQVRNIKRDIADGKIKIIIGTHMLLSKAIKFHDLGLVIIDEEQHFGVSQKERLKELKENVHTLTLSATPIPRTLQMSLLGIKDLSLIATPPIDRLAVRTSVIAFDNSIIRDALMREHFRGGRSFFVCPRIKDIDDIEKILMRIVPELKIKVAHGQTSPNQIDQIMTDFYQGKFDVLLSTAIIESGIDIPAANTILIYKAEIFGLSQLYQLRGRVGRGKVRGYAYLLLDAKKLPTKLAIKRLEIMQTVDSLGAGFSIASHDMDIRGYGNLVGEEQSGHIREVGVELYQDMLEDAINQQQNLEKANEDWVPQVKINVSVYIPEDYITDQSLRLSIYRRIGGLKSEEEIEHFRDELYDRFGSVPGSVDNLLAIVHLKLDCKKLYIEQLDAGEGGFSIKFHSMTSPDKIVNFVKKYPRHTKIKPNNKLIIIRDLTDSNTIIEARKIIKDLEMM